MTEPATGLTRKLTTIFCADVQGYSAMVEQDEVGTVNRLKQYRAIMVEEIERHQGRAINTWGDGLLAEFSSPVQAVFCAVETQRRLKSRNAEAPASSPMQFRIGINLGDVMVDGNDLYGEGVNIAARLEALAEPGGICISGTVFEQVRKKLDIGFVFIGEREIKNIAEPVPAYRVVADLEQTSAHSSATTEAAAVADNTFHHGQDAFAAWKRRAWRYGVVIALLAVINLVTSPGYFWFIWPTLWLVAMLAWKYPFGGTQPTRGSDTPD